MAASPCPSASVKQKKKSKVSISYGDLSQRLKHPLKKLNVHTYILFDTPWLQTSCNFCLINILSMVALKFRCGSVTASLGLFHELHGSLANHSTAIAE